MSEKVGSFLPADFTEGGFFDDKDATIVKAEVVEFDYAGQRSDDPVCALAITYHPDDAEGADDDRTEYYGIGPMTKFTPSADRKHYIPTGATGAMNKNAKAALYLRALHEKGFDLSTLSDGIDKLEGLHVHVNIVPMPEMKGRPGEPAREKKPTILLVTKIHDAPAAGASKASGKKAAPAASKKAAAAPAAAAPAAAPAASGGGGDVDEATAAQLTEIILGLLAERNGGPLPKTLIPGALFKQIPADQGALRTAAMRAAANVAWLSGDDQPWTYEGGNLTMK